MAKLGDSAKKLKSIVKVQLLFGQLLFGRFVAMRDVIQIAIWVAMFVVMVTAPVKAAETANVSPTLESDKVADVRSPDAVSAEAKAQEAKAESQMVFPPLDHDLLTLFTLKNIAHSHSYWVQFDVGGSIYDARREAFAGRYSPGLQFGRRFRNFGAFLNIELDRTIDLSQEVKVMDVWHFGPGIEYLWLLGRARSSASSGFALLNSDTDIDRRGRRGWYVDVRPVSLRWQVNNSLSVELTPISVDVSVPVTKGIPLVLYSYFTLFAIEWAGSPLR